MVRLDGSADGAQGPRSAQSHAEADAAQPGDQHVYTVEDEGTR